MRKNHINDETKTTMEIILFVQDGDSAVDDITCEFQ